MSARQLKRQRERDARRQARRMDQRARRAAAAAGAALGAAVLFAPPADAATFTVTTLADTNDNTCDADCSLREAAFAANQADGDDLITFASNVTGTIELSTSLGHISLTDDGVQIQGPGAGLLTVSGEDDDRIFKLFGFDAPNEQVVISGLTLANGLSGAGIFGGGAIHNSEGLGFAPYAADLAIADSVLTDNETSSTGDPDEAGGAIKSLYGDVTITNSTISGNYAYFDGGGVYVDQGSLTVANSTITGNEADDDGGGVYVDETPSTGATEVTISDSTVSDNSAIGGDGGGIYVNNPAGAVVVERSTISNNDAEQFKGGGLGINNLEPPGLTISNSTISGNEIDGMGAGVYVNNADGAVAIRDSAITGNTATADGGGIGINNLGDFSTGGGPRHFVLERSTVAGNSAANGGAFYANNVFAETVIEQSTLSGNSAAYAGGGIHFNNVDDIPVEIRNSTISANRAVDPATGRGGGVYVYDVDGATITIGNSTVVQNSAAASGGGIFRWDEAPVISSSIVAQNTAPDGADLGEDDANAVGLFQIEFSLIGSTAGATFAESTGGSNLVGVDPQLGPLAANGGPTQTHLPAVGSPVLEAGIANGLTTDQRGLARTLDATNVANKAGSDATDIGAVELAAGTCKGKPATVLFAPGQKINGSNGNDVIVGTNAKDKISAKGGKDTVCAGKGNDKVKGGGGKDKLFGEKGKDKLTGQAGNDKLVGAAGNDILKGGGGKDTLKGGPGKDKLRGGPGNDKLSGGGGKDSEVQ